MGPIAKLERGVKMLVRTGLDQIDGVMIDSTSQE